MASRGYRAQSGFVEVRRLARAAFLVRHALSTPQWEGGRCRCFLKAVQDDQRPAMRYNRNGGRKRGNACRGELWQGGGIGC
ncbi:MAG: hypothetical protein KatS3mg110_1594 [Pirellulaceae bacterium]|nr:MAG: hypothetical protein KatS3mg110_1594 [Pirellulaceae bacterium]